MKYASWGTRVGAYIIDSLVLLPLVILSAIFDESTIDPQTGEMTGSGPLYWIFVVLGIVLNGYNRWFMAGRTGQSWGKRALGIRLVGATSGEPIGTGRAFLRDIAHLVDGLICYIGYLFPLWDAKKQTISDKIVKTVVTG